MLLGDEPLSHEAPDSGAYRDHADPEVSSDFRLHEGLAGHQITRENGLADLLVGKVLLRERNRYNTIIELRVNHESLPLLSAGTVD